MKQTIRLSERELHRLISESVKRVLNESGFGGWTQDPMEWPVVNTSEDGNNMYKVGIWWGSGYLLDIYLVWATAVDNALEKVVAYIDKHNPESLEQTTRWAEETIEELSSEHGVDRNEVTELPEFNERFYYIDATMEGASQPYYIFYENLTIDNVPNEWKQKFLAREQQNIQTKLDESIRKAIRKVLG